MTQPAEHLSSLIEKRLTRRQVLGGVVASAATVSLGCEKKATPQKQQTNYEDLPTGQGGSGDQKNTNASTLGFQEIEHAIDQQAHVAKDHDLQVVVSWGDPMFDDSPKFDANNLTPESQLKQFGYNNDFVAYLPLPQGSDNSDHGLLCVNNEYVSAEIMFAGVEYKTKWKTMTKQQTMVEMAAHGHSVVEIKKENGKWNLVNGKWNRRLSALNTRFDFSGPAAGHDRMKTTDCPDGRQCTGTLNNCAGGVTPWGTVLIAEENFHGYFGGKIDGGPEIENYKIYEVGKNKHSWYRFFRRFNVELEPNSPNLYGWVVEFDPFDPQSMPVKRTALGRVRHEGATTALTADGRLVVYSGDDQADQFVYRFVTTAKCNPENRAANKNILDEGVLSVAKFDADGSMKWLPLIYGQGPLINANGFQSQADVLIETRKAAKLLGATPMDRPEDAETNPVTGRVYVMLTNNNSRTETNHANPRPKNIHGHIIEMIPPEIDGKVDHGAESYQWDIFLQAGDPAKEKVKAKYHEQVTEHGWLSCPDNCTFDAKGRLWIATDGATNTSGFGDAIYACDTTGEGRALTKQFFRGPVGAEICGPCFTPDNKTMFAAVQHPGEGSSFSKPSTRWPDFDENIPPRPSVIAITRHDGKRIG